MKDPVFGINELRDTIKTLGFLPMDRIVVRKWKGMPEKYVVIEGNRRVTALKWLIALNDTGKETFTERQIANFTMFSWPILAYRLRGRRALGRAPRQTTARHFPPPGHKYLHKFCNYLIFIQLLLFIKCANYLFYKG
ncbi:MAG: ParB/Srx family N-terminal domain-containing protein [Methylovulum sp.]|nr:ParB/Srx family N-terminal domain-containing protein [Methylovulum sp.]